MNNDLFGHSWGDLPMIFTRDENQWQITPLVTKKSLFMVTHALFFISYSFQWVLNHWGRVTPICVRKLAIIGPDNIWLSPSRHQAIIWTNTGILLIRIPGTNFSEILIESHTFSFTKCVWKYHLRNGGNFVLASINGTKISPATS